MTIDEALYNIKQGYGIPHKHDTLTTITGFVTTAKPLILTFDKREDKYKEYWNRRKKNDNPRKD